jgi:hypothetical protein
LRPPRADRIWGKRIKQFESQSQRAETSGRPFLARSLIGRATDVAKLLSDSNEKTKTLTRLGERQVELNQLIFRAKESPNEPRPVMA